MDLPRLGHRAGASPDVPMLGYMHAAPYCGSISEAFGPPDLSVSDIEITSPTGNLVNVRYLVKNCSAAPVYLDGLIAWAVVSADHVAESNEENNTVVTLLTLAP